MADLVVLIGPPASGKAAIGLALARTTGLRLFHNHMTADPVAALFGWGTPLFGEMVAAMRLLLIGKALDQAEAPGVIFTLTWAFNLGAHNAFMRDLVALAETKGSKIHFVELRASREARMDREGTLPRVRLKPGKRDVARARADHASLDERHRFNSNGDFPWPVNHWVIDTEAQLPPESALLIAEHFGLALVAETGAVTA